MKGLVTTLTVLLAASALVAPSAAAPPAATSVQIESRAAFVVPPSSIMVSVVVQCPAGTTVTVFVEVSQQQAAGPNTTGSGNSGPRMCTGANQRFAVVVTGGPFTPGRAFARAVAFQPGIFAANAIDFREIAIS
jgi:hypothetical protein